MRLRNTRLEYGSVAKWLHWGVAVLVLGSYVTMYTRMWFTGRDTPWHGTLAHWHFSIGISIGCLMLLRLIWRESNKRPTLRALSPAHRRGARLSHAALYVLLLFMPLSGYLSTGADTHFFGLFDITAFKDTALFQSTGWSADVLKPLKALHHWFGAWIVWSVVAFHACAGLIHHFVHRDDMLRRMTTGLSEERASHYRRISRR